MPHFNIEYSANVESIVDMSALCDQVRKAAIETGIFPLAGVRVRAIRCDHYSIADGDANRYFIDMSIRLRAGRPVDKKQAATQYVFEQAQAFLKDVIDQYPFALSLEMRDIDPDLSPKLNTIRQYISE